MAAPVESMTVTLPVRLVAPVPLKFTVIVQVLPAATLWPEQVSAPLLNRLPATVAAPNVTEPEPTTVSVTTLETVPGWLPNASVLPANAPGFVAEVNDTCGATPVPVSVADTGVGGCTVVLLVPPIVTVADADPAAVGANATLTVHEAPTGRLAPQLAAFAGNPPLVTRVKGAAIPVTVIPLRGELPVFVTVRF
jgi:hypothetical protein